MINQIIKQVSTKRFEGDDAVITTLTLDFTGLTDEDVQEIAAAGAVIKWQSKVRAKTVPSTDTYKVPKPGTRAVAAPMTDEQLIDELERRGLINRVIKLADSYEPAVEAEEK
jgi:hypothetical protein